MAEKKKDRVDVLRQQIMLVSLLAAIVVGICMVLVIFFIKYIAFNTKVITEKDKSIENYSLSIRNVGLCKDENGNGKIDEGELDRCNPEELDVAELEGTLRHNILMNMAKNKNLESVGRESLAQCLDKDGKKINFEKRYANAKSGAKSYNLSMLRMCSALRAIPDALPASKNNEALMASLNQIFIQSNWEPQSLSPGDEETGVSEGIGAMPLSLSVEADSQTTNAVLTNLERSIRDFNIKTATIGWNGGKLDLKANAESYYAQSKVLEEQTQTVYASEKAQNKANKVGGNK